MRTLEQVKELFDNEGCQLLEEVYINNRTPMRYIAQCGHPHIITWDNFRAGKGRLCKECRYKLISKKNKNTYEEVLKEFEKADCKLLTKEYIDANRQKLEYIAQCGHKNFMTFTHFKLGGGRVCNKCSKSIRYEYDYVVEAFENKGCVLLESEYHNCKEPLHYIAQCGHEDTVTFDAFNNSDNVSLRCKECRKIKYYDIEKVRKLFADNGCQLLSDTYKRKSYNLKYIAQCNNDKTTEIIKMLISSAIRDM